MRIFHFINKKITNIAFEISKSKTAKIFKDLLLINFLH